MDKYFATFNMTWQNTLEAMVKLAQEKDATITELRAALDSEKLAHIRTTSELVEARIALHNSEACRETVNRLADEEREKLDAVRVKFSRAEAAYNRAEAERDAARAEFGISEVGGFNREFNGKQVYLIEVAGEGDVLVEGAGERPPRSCLLAHHDNAVVHLARAVDRLAGLLSAIGLLQDVIPKQQTQLAAHRPAPEYKDKTK